MKIKFKKIKIERPDMLVWSIVPIMFLVLVTNYIFTRSDGFVLGTSVVEDANEQKNDEVISTAKEKLNSFNYQNNGAVTLVFTGAYKSQYEIGYKKLKDLGIKAVVSVPTEEIEKGSRMSWLNLKVMQNQGWEIASQSKNQICDIDSLNNPDIAHSETYDSKDVLNNNSIFVDAYLAPCGIVTKTLKSEVEKNYSSLITFGTNYNDPRYQERFGVVARSVSNKTNAEDIDVWINEASKKNKWLVVAIPEISNDHSLDVLSEENFNNLIDKIETSNLQNALIGNLINYE